MELISSDKFNKELVIKITQKELFDSINAANTLVAAKEIQLFKERNETLTSLPEDDVDYIQYLRYQNLLNGFQKIKEEFKG